MPEKTSAQKRAQKKYMETKAAIQFVVTPERRDAIKSHAAAHGESLSGFINRAVDSQIERDNEAEIAAKAARTPSE